jgi:hypothetical protein
MSAPIGVFTVLIKRSALDANYPGGSEAYLGSHQGLPHDDALVGAGAMSSQDLQYALDNLRAFDPHLGRDVAVGDMVHGKWSGAPGIVFCGEARLPGSICRSLIHGPPVASAASRVNAVQGNDYPAYAAHWRRYYHCVSGRIHRYAQAPGHRKRAPNVLAAEATRQEACGAEVEGKPPAIDVHERGST